MTSDEIKEQVSVDKILREHGVKVKGNMCSCPFHKDIDPSMALYPPGNGVKKTVKCFSCGFSGDVFALTMKLDNCDFKTAFISLGGTYDHMSQNARIRAISKREAQKKARERAEQEERKFYKALCKALTICECAVNVFEPYSDEWCYLLNKLPYLQYAFDEKYLNGNEVNEVDVYRLSRTINSRYLTGA